MTRIFLPKSHVEKTALGFVALYRWWRDAEWKTVPGTAPFDNREDAETAADDHLAKGLNTASVFHVERAEDALGVKEWRARKAKEREVDRQRVALETMQVRGREVQIEKRKI